IQAVSESLKLKNEELHQFALTLSHDIKSPLAGIQQLAELIQENMPKEANARVHTSVDMIRTTGLRLQEMIIAVLEYYRLGDHAQSEPEDIEIEQFLKENAALALDSLQGKYEVFTDVINVTYKKAVLQLVLLNLIENAFRHNQNEDLLIRISARKMDNLIRIAVQDNGQGFNPEILNQMNGLFKSPTQKDRFGRRSYGMGLAKVRKLLETEGSELQIESQSGKGSVFFFDIPA
ncbi:MAG: sensor histidine kinase, partial [Bacteroidota bacterium]